MPKDNTVKFPPIHLPAPASSIPKESDYAPVKLDKDVKADTPYDQFLVVTLKKLKDGANPRLLKPLFLACYGLAQTDTPETRGIRREIAIELGWKP